METVRVRSDKQFSDEQYYRETPIKTGKIEFNIYDFKPWQALPMHRHPKSDTVMYIVQGQGTAFIEDEEWQADANTAFYLPADAPYGFLAGENDVVIIAVQGPVPVETRWDEGLAYQCPACKLEAPLTTDTQDGSTLTCPRCNAALKLTKGPGGFRAERIAEGAPAWALPGARDTGQTMAWVAGGAKEAGEGGAYEACEEAQAKLELGIHEFKSWQALPMQKNPNSDTILYVVKGQGILLADDEARSVDRDVAIYLPAGSTYGILAADNEMTFISMQGPTPVERRVDQSLAYNCPTCDLGTPVTTNTFDGCVTVCPRCNVKLMLKKAAGVFKAEVTKEPAPAEAETM